MKGESAPPCLTYKAAFAAMDAVESAETNLNGTFEVLAYILNAVDVDPSAQLMLTLERHLETDRKALAAAIENARDVILRPLHAQAYPNGPPRAL